MQADKPTEGSNELQVPAGTGEATVAGPKQRSNEPLSIDELFDPSALMSIEDGVDLSTHLGSIFQDSPDVVVAEPLVPGRDEYVVQIDTSKLSHALNLIGQFADVRGSTPNLSFDFSSTTGNSDHKTLRLSVEEISGTITCEVPLVGQGLIPAPGGRAPKFRVNLGIMQALANSTPTVGVIGLRIRRSRLQLVVVVEFRERPIILYDMTDFRPTSDGPGELSFRRLDTSTFCKVLHYLALFAADQDDDAFRGVYLSAGVGRAGSPSSIGLVEGTAMAHVQLSLDVDLAVRLDGVLAHFSQATDFACTDDLVIIREEAKELVLKMRKLPSPDLGSIKRNPEAPYMLVPRLDLQRALENLMGETGVVQISIAAQASGKVDLALSAIVDKERWDECVHGDLRGSGSVGAVWTAELDGLALLGLVKSLGSANVEIEAAEGVMLITGDIEDTGLTTVSAFVTRAPVGSL